MLSEPGNETVGAFGLRVALPDYLIKLYKSLGELVVDCCRSGDLTRQSHTRNRDHQRARRRRTAHGSSCCAVKRHSNAPHLI